MSPGVVVEVEAPEFDGDLESLLDLDLNSNLPHESQLVKVHLFLFDLLTCDD